MQWKKIRLGLILSVALIILAAILSGGNSMKPTTEYMAFFCFVVLAVLAIPFIRYLIKRHKDRNLRQTDLLNLRFMPNGTSPDVMLRRSVLKAIYEDPDRAQRHNSGTRLTIFLLACLCCATMGCIWFILKESLFFPAGMLAAVGVFLLLCLTCRREDQVINKCMEQPDADIAVLAREDADDDQRHGLIPLGAALIAITLLTTGYMFYQQDISNPLAFTLQGDEYILDGFRDWARYNNSLIIPQTYKGKAVTAIADSAFMGRWFEAVTIPASIRRIGNRAFSDTGIEQITFEGDPAISDYAFSKTKLEAVDLPDSMTSIPEGLFSECDRLTKVVVPAGVTEIGAKAFYGCKKLYDINLPAGIKEIHTEAFRGCTSLAFPQPADDCVLHSYALAGTRITEFTLPAAMAEVPDGLFCSCRNLTDIRLHDGVTSIGEAAFVETALPGFDIPKGLTEIHARAFWGCTQLQTVGIPEGVTTIGASAFEYCSALQSIDLPASVAELHENAFANCENLSDIRIQGSPTLHAGVFSNTGITAAIIPEGVTEIHARLFANCNNLNQIHMPEGLLVIGASAFEGCKALVSVALPASVTDVHEDAFAQCINLSDIQMHGSPVLHAGVFRGTGVTAAIIPAGVTEIRARLFADCHNLESIELPEGLLAIGAEAFSGCPLLQEAVIPSTVTDISENAFAKCLSLTSLVLKGPSEMHAGVLSYTAVASFAFPEGTVKVHASALAGCKSLTSVTLPEGIVEIGAHAFEECSGLTAIKLPSSCRVIGASAFASSGIETIEFPATMEDIGSEAFRNCKSLVKLVLPSGITSVRADLCNSCSSLEKVVIPEGVTEVRAHAFQYCRSLSNVTVPSTLRSIGSSAFRDCSSLYSITIPSNCSTEKNSFKSSPTSVTRK